MQSHKNNIIIAAAGSGKTTSIVESALQSDRTVAITTYTINNAREIRSKFYEICGSIPDNVSIITWFRFLLSDWIRPYRHSRCEHRVEGIIFTEGRSGLYIPKSQNAYYFGSGYRIYTDKISEFALMCNEESGGLVLRRLTELYQHIFVDEVQDLAGFDLDLLDVLRDSEIRMTLVGDPRQATYKTNHSPKNSQYGGAEIVDRFQEWEKLGKCSIEYLTSSHRCNQKICDFADSIYPKAANTTSIVSRFTGHDGVFIVGKGDVQAYVERYDPVCLRNNKRTSSLGTSAINFGASKGLTFPRVLVFPTGPLAKMLKTGQSSHLTPVAAAKAYVVVTRARYSVAFVYDGPCGINGVTKWNGECN